MKNLIFINGPMAVGKTATSKALLKLLPNCVMLDGDWCWYADPFIVNDETKGMVEDNMAHLLNNFLNCSVYENVIFCWVMHLDLIIDKILSLIENTEYRLFKFSLICTEDALRARMQKDIDTGVREDDNSVARTLERLGYYWDMDTVKLDVSDITPEEAARVIFDWIYPAKTPDSF